MISKVNKRGASVLALGLAGALALPSIAAADNINDNIEDNSTGVSIAAGGSGTASIKVVSTNGDVERGCNIDAGETFTLAFVAPAGVSVPNLTITECDEFYPVTISTTSAAVSGTITATIATNTTGAGEYNNNVAIPVTITGGSTGGSTGGGTPTPPAPPDGDLDGIPDSSDNCVSVANADQADADSDGVGNACDSNSYSPAVGTQAGAANGNEGSVGNPSTSGSFTDQDGNSSLTITKVSGAGDVADNGDGTFTWSHTTTDDASGTVTVKASDGAANHTDATQTFTWSAANVAPVVQAVTVTRNGACAVTLGATFTDAGSADTHTTSVVWDDNSSTALSRTFTSAGSYDATVTVTDDDGGADSEGVTGVRAYNTPSAIMEPINTTGTRSSFKQGSTIPVKITVKGCDGSPVTNLTPVVELVQGDAIADIPVNEPSVAEVATNGKTMRWSTDKYIYNISTKLSQHTSAVLSGTYTVAVTDPSFERSVNAKATFDVRK